MGYPMTPQPWPGNVEDHQRRTFIDKYNGGDSWQECGLCMDHGPTENTNAGYPCIWLTEWLTDPRRTPEDLVHASNHHTDPDVRDLIAEHPNCPDWLQVAIALTR